MSPKLRLILAIAAVFAVFVVGTIGYMIVDRGRCPSLADAAYMTVITLSSVGYGEIWDLSQAARVWTILIITFGIATVSLALTSLLSLVVSGELRSLRERRRMEDSLKHMHKHVIVCGYGRMGALIARELRQRGVSVVVIEKQRTLEPDLRYAEATYIIGDATEEETLLHAGLQRAKALVIVLPSDADNVYTTLTAHTLCPTLTIVARAEQLSTEVKLTRAGATRVICPQAIGATKVANILTRPTVVDFVEVADKRVDLEIDEYEILEGSPLVGRSLRDSDIRRKTGAVVVAIKRADGPTMLGPDPDAQLQAKDTLILIGQAGVSARLGAIGATG